MQNVRKYLSQAFHLNMLIDSKLEQIASLREKAVKTTSSLTTLSVGGTAERSKLEGCVVRLVTLEEEISTDIDKLVDVKRNIQKVISQVENPRHRLVLELRYLNYFTWEQIAEKTNYSYRNVTYLHSKALKSIKPFLVFPILT